MVTNFAPAAIQFLNRQLGIYAGKSILQISGREVSPLPAMVQTGAVVHTARFDQVHVEQNFSVPSFDVVICAQCFERMDGARTLEVIHKLLKPFGALALIWNARDESVHWFAQIGQLIRPFEERAGLYPQMHWRDAFDRSTYFSRLEYERFRYCHKATPRDVLEVIPEGVPLRAQVQRVIESHRDTRDVKELEIPYRTDAYFASRL